MSKTQITLDALNAALQRHQRNSRPQAPPVSGNQAALAQAMAQIFGNMQANNGPNMGANYVMPAADPRTFHMPNMLEMMDNMQVQQPTSQVAVGHTTLNGRFSKAKYENVGRNIQHASLQRSVMERVNQISNGGQQPFGARFQFTPNVAPVSTTPVDTFLQPAFVEGKVIEKMNPGLMWLDLATRFTTTAKEIIWFRHRHSAHGDPKLRRPKRLRSGSVFPRAALTDPERQQVSVGMWGIALDFTRDELRYTNQAVDNVQRKINAIIYDMQREVNAIYGNVLTNDFDETQAGLAEDDKVVVEIATNPWSSSNANPIEDIRDLALKMAREDGFFADATELWLTPTSFRELLDYATSVDHRWVINPLTGETVRQVDDITIRRAPEAAGLPEGKGVMLARGGEPVLTVWDAIDAEFTRTGILHTDTFRDNETKITTVQVWKEFAAVNRLPKRTGLLSGI